MVEGSMSPYPFLSHSGDDDTSVTELASRLKDFGIEVWADHLGGIELSDDLYKKVQKGLNICDMTLVALSRSSAQKEAVWNESLQTRRLGKRLYVALMEEIPPEEFPWFLNTTLYVDLSSDFDSGVVQLVEAMRKNRGLDITNEHVDVKRKRTSRKAVDPRFYAEMRGRDDDLERVETLLRSGRPTFITGIGGIGKSRVAHEVALRAVGVSGVIWQECSDVSSANDILDLLKEHLGLPLNAQPSVVYGNVKAHNMLIVIDNAESVQEKDSRAYYIEATNKLSQAGCQVLYTSREMWEGYWGAQSYTLQDLAASAAADVCHEMSKFAAVSLTRQESESLATSAVRHPRLIEQAVTMCKTTDFERVLDSLAQLKSRPVEEALDEMLTRSIQLMKENDTEFGPAAARVLERLNVFRGGFTRDAASSLIVTSDTFGFVHDEYQLDDIVRLLQRWEFVNRDIDSKRYSIHALVVAAVGEDESAYDEHYKYFKSLAMEQSQRDDFHGLDPEIDNLTAAFERKLQQGEIRKAFFLCQNCVRLFFNRMRFEEWQEMLERVRHSVLAEEDEDLNAHLMEALGDSYAHTQLGNRRENLLHAISHYEKSLDYFIRREYAPKCVALLHNIALMYQMLYESERRIEHLKNAVNIYHGVLHFQEPSESAPTWSNLGLCLYRMGELEDDVATLECAAEYFSKAIDISSARGSVLRLANTLIGFADTHIALAKHKNPDDNLKSARAKYEYALQFATPESDPQAYSLIQFNMAKLNHSIAVQDQNLSFMHNAVAGFEEALRYCSSRRTPGQRAMILHALGIAQIQLGNADLAIKLWCEAKECFEMVSNLESARMVQDLIERTET